MNRSKNFLSVIIPAYNESNRIIPSLNRILEFFNHENISYEIIVVSDGSLDNTVDVVKDLSKKHKEIKIISYSKNKGKGYAVKTGVLNSKGNYILFSDADLSTPIKEWRNLMVWAKNGYDFAFGSRGIDRSKVKVLQPFYRRAFAFLAKIYVKIVMFPLGNSPKDTQCGFKLFTRKSADFLFKKMRLDGGMFDIELIYLARKFNIKTKELPVIWRDKPDSKINFIKCIIFDPIDLIKIRIWDLFKTYD